MTATILDRVASGEPAAVPECIERYSPLVWAIARGFFHDPNEAEDAVQEIFIDLWKSAGRFDSERGSESNFIGTIARRRLIDRRRKLARRKDGAPLVADPEDPGTGFEEAVERSEEAERAKQMLAELRPLQRSAIELSIFQGYTHEQISAAMDMPLGTVKSHVRRGLQSLRKRLVSHGVAPSGAPS